MNKPKWIFENYISPRALPKEQVLGWIKWESDIQYDKILIKYDPDVVFHRILNVDESIFDQAETQGYDVRFKNSTAVIEKNLIQIPGFLGFRVAYNLKPEDEKELTFLIEFIKNEETIGSVELTTELIRPKLTITERPSEGIVVNEFIPSLPSLSFTLKNMGHGEVEKLDPFLDVKSWETKDMKIEVKHTKERDVNEDHVFVMTTVRYIPKIIIRGSGMGMISMGFEYYDKMNNKYETELVSVPLNIPKKESLEIPVSSTISNKQTLLLEPRLL